MGASRRRDTANVFDDVLRFRVGRRPDAANAPPSLTASFCMS